MSRLPDIPELHAKWGAPYPRDSVAEPSAADPVSVLFARLTAAYARAYKKEPRIQVWLFYKRWEVETHHTISCGLGEQKVVYGPGGEGFTLTEAMEEAITRCEARA